MSNMATIQPTIFEDHNTNEKSYGVRVFDNYAQTYDNTWENIPDDDFAMLQMVIDNENEVMCSIIDYVIENQNGIMIGQAYYDWEDIKHLIVEI